MAILKQEIRQNRISLLVWTLAIGLMLMMCVVIYPEMKHEMEDVSQVFSSMGSFSTAFGMDQLNFGEFMGFYCVECGNVVGIGGALFAALIGISALAKEEKEHTAEFLLTHPVSRVQVVLEKYVAVVVQILLLNAVIVLLSVAAIKGIGEDISWEDFRKVHEAYTFLQLQLASMCFGISAYMRRNSLGLGIGIAIGMYFLNLISNMAEQVDVLKYITPFGYTEGADIINGGLDESLMLLGGLYGAVGVLLAFIKYGKKDIS